MGGGSIRMTQSRKAILSALSKACDHPTADEVYLMVREVLPHVSLGTVYRNLDFLAREGLIRTVAAAGQQRRYDGMLMDHHHIRCDHCGRVDDVELEDAAAVERLLVSGRGYDVRGYTLCFVGLCSDCAAEGGNQGDSGKEK